MLQISMTAKKDADADLPGRLGRVGSIGSSQREGRATARRDARNNLELSGGVGPAAESPSRRAVSKRSLGYHRCKISVRFLLAVPVSRSFRLNYQCFCVYTRRQVKQQKSPGSPFHAAGTVLMVCPVFRTHSMPAKHLALFPCTSCHFLHDLPQ